MEKFNAWDMKYIEKMEREPFTKADLYYLEHQDAYELQKA
jgi:hypothetical protein